MYTWKPIFVTGQLNLRSAIINHFSSINFLLSFLFQSLCADENCDKSGSHQIQDGGQSIVVSSPSKSTAENGAKGKGTMREASLPSLPFGSPALDRDSREKDRTVERDAPQLTTTNPSSISTSPATHTHREDFPRIIERESSSSVINTDGKLSFYLVNVNTIAIQSSQRNKHGNSSGCIYSVIDICLVILVFISCINNTGREFIEQIKVPFVHISTSISSIFFFFHFTSLYSVKIKLKVSFSFQLKTKLKGFFIAFT